MDSWIRNLPKAELHLHIEGTLESELMFELAKRNRVPLRFSSIDKVRKAYHFQNLQSFLDIYYEGTSVLVHEQDFYDLAMAYFIKASSQNVRHAEIFFDPQTHTERGISVKTMVSGISHAAQSAEKELGMSVFLIPCFLRHLSSEQAMQTLDELLPFKEKFVAVGLDSSEVGNPPTKFKNVFQKALQEGLLTVAHAGEEGPPEYIWQALEELKVSRIDHGIRCLEDARLVKTLAMQKIGLTVCPLSNVKLKVFKKMERHNLKKLFEKELMVTINSDDPAYFGGYVNENYVAAIKALQFKKKEIIQLVKNSFLASFMDAEKKQRFIREVEECM